MDYLKIINFTTIFEVLIFQSDLAIVLIPCSLKWLTFYQQNVPLEHCIDFLKENQKQLMYSAEECKSNDFGIREEYDNIIKQTRSMIKGMNIQNRFEKAKSHIIDSLKNKQPRPMSYSPELTTTYHILYAIQSSLLWDWLTFILSYTYMYLVILDRETYTLKIVLQAIILAIFLFDIFIDFYCKSFDKFKVQNRYSAFDFLKLFLLLLMVIDLILFATMPGFDSRPIRPFRVLRAFVPLLYDFQFRKSLFAIGSAYRDLLVFFIYYTIIIVGFAFIGSKTLTFDPNYKDPNPAFTQTMDNYKTNYSNLSKMIFQIYSLSTYDFYPDNQILAVQNYQPNYIFFIIFIFFNLFLFTSIPGGLIYSKFRETRSKYIIVDQLKQQHSLILAFVTLAQDENNLSMQTLIEFLFYFYKKKARYVQHITEICLKLDDNNNQTIQVNEFMEFSKILLYNSIMYPPLFQDWNAWIQFRRLINSTIGLKNIVNHIVFDVVIAVIIILGAVNCIFYLNSGSNLTKTFDTVIVWLYLSQIIVRIIGVGPQKHFHQGWSIIDAIMAILSVIFLFVETGSKFDEFVKIFRLLRIIGLIKMILTSKYITRKRFQIIQKIKRLFSTFVEIMPIIIKFFNVFAFFFYIFSIIGMQVFYSPQFYDIEDNTQYNNQIQFSNFNSFIHSQYVMMQILTQGQWSYTCYNYAWRFSQNYGYIVFFFIIMHMTIIHVTSTLIKGIFWQIYFTVSSMMDEIEEKIQQQYIKEEQNQIKIQQMNEISMRVLKSEAFDPNTIIKRQLIEMKLDNQILKRIKNFQFYDRESSEDSQQLRNLNRSKLVTQIMSNWNISARQLIPKKKISVSSPMKLKKKKASQLLDPQDAQQQQFQLEMEQLLNRLIISSKITFSQIVAYPPVFINFLDSKFKRPLHYMVPDKFDMNFNPLYNEESMSFHTYAMNNFLGVESSTREKRNLIIDCLLRNNLINDDTAEKILNTQHVLTKFRIDTNGALRKMYLAETNEKLVKKFEIEYFYNVYGNSFRKINKITLEPLLQFQSTLMYSLWNIFRYPQIDTEDFFHLLTHIEDQMSNKLIKKGSLVKFVYKIDHESDIWFVVEKKKYQEMKIRFIKTGLWVHTPNMQDNKQYFAKDVFKWDTKLEKDKKICNQYIKLFYQSFQTLAFSLINKKAFFEVNPQEYIYDLYVKNFQVQRNGKKSSMGQLKISNIMLIVLAKQQQRLDVGENLLPYQLSDIKSAPREKKQEDFILQQDDTYEKLKNLGAEQQQKIIQNEGLPFAYILNSMKQISDMLKIYSQNFKTQVQKALNEAYSKVVDEKYTDSDQSLISLPEINLLYSEEDQ